MNATGVGIVHGFGIPGLRELVLVALVALALYGRVGSRVLLSTRYGRSLGPWARLARMAVTPAAASDPRKASARSTAPLGPARRLLRGRLFWALAMTIAAAVAAWVATRVVIHTAAGLPR
jgi:hypothetical protein